jgi:hypothetical protein
MTKSLKQLNEAEEQVPAPFNGAASEGAQAQEGLGGSRIGRIFILWHMGAGVIRRGVFRVRNGRPVEIRCRAGEALLTGEVLEIRGGEPVLVEVAVEIDPARYGRNVTVVHWEADAGSFSFVPVYIPRNGCISIPDMDVSLADDPARLNGNAQAASSCGAPEVMGRGDSPRGREIGWEAWVKRTAQPAPVPTVLGLSRDQRLFVVDVSLEGSVKASHDLTVPTLLFDLGMAGTAEGVASRSLEDGYMPILLACQRVGEVEIERTFFVSYADRPLTAQTLAGTPFKVAHLSDGGCTFPPGEKERLAEESRGFEPVGEVVLFLRTRLTNRSDIPQLAAQRLPRAHQYNKSKSRLSKTTEWESLRHSVPRLDEGGVLWEKEAPLSMHFVNGAPAAAVQPCVLLEPGESLTIDSLLSHAVGGLSEGAREAGIPWEAKLAEAKLFWQEKPGAAAAVSLPEKRLENFWRAGLAHLELITLGEEKGGPLLPKVGVYPPIGSESIPVVEFYDSVGLHETAGRSLDSFFELQHPDGRINLFTHYDVETGGALLLAGRHFSYTRDLAWVRERVARFKRAGDYLLRQRRLENPEAPWHGLVAGTCADPEGATTAFMLNAYNAAGLRALADMLEATGDAEAACYRQAAEEYVARLRKALARSFAEGPVLPTAPGRWVPSCAPWVEGIGLQVMGLGGEACFTHRTYHAYDALLGPLYAVFAGVVGWEERGAQWLLEVMHSQLKRASLAESQPYYSRHPEVHLLRGEREAFLNAFYSGLASLADRETFTFWEHYHQVSIHKTHEEGWALMQLRRMLWLEAGRELRLLPGVPEEWTDPGKVIEVKRAGSYFGPFSFRVERSSDGKQIELDWAPGFQREPAVVRVHLPGVKLPRETGDPRLRVSPEWLEILEPGRALTAKLSLE